MNTLHQLTFKVADQKITFTRCESPTSIAFNPFTVFLFADVDSATPPNFKAKHCVVGERIEEVIPALISWNTLFTYSAPDEISSTAIAAALVVA